MIGLHAHLKFPGVRFLLVLFSLIRVSNLIYFKEESVHFKAKAEEVLQNNRYLMANSGQENSYSSLDPAHQKSVEELTTYHIYLLIRINYSVGYSFKTFQEALYHTQLERVGSFQRVNHKIRSLRLLDYHNSPSVEAVAAYPKFRHTFVLRNSLVTNNRQCPTNVAHIIRFAANFSCFLLNIYFSPVCYVNLANFIHFESFFVLHC